MATAVSAALLSYAVPFAIAVCKNSACSKLKLPPSKAAVLASAPSKAAGSGLPTMFMGRFIVLFIMCNCGFLLCNKSPVAAPYIPCAPLMDPGNIRLPAPSCTATCSALEP